jgi:hypothetical protein
MFMHIIFIGKVTEISNIILMNKSIKYQRFRIRVSDIVATFTLTFFATRNSMKFSITK